MKLTKERKIYAGLFIVAACAFAGDQIFSGPKEAAANADVAVVTARPAPAATATAVSNHTLITTELAQKLRALDHDQALSAAPLSDPFTLSKTWETSDASVDGRLSGFNQRHHLTAVMVGGARESSAIIDGQLVRVGQSIDGFKLIEVSRTSATFECHKQLARLVLADN
jgi:hypothetical protein